ncbi:MAG: sensor histidine kinase [Spirochaetales bacterium]|nr:sensor histidine kinase [Spirochaetales bacterium]
MILSNKYTNLKKQISSLYSKGRLFELFLNIIFLSCWYIVTISLFSSAIDIPDPWRSQGYIIILLTWLMSAVFPFIKGKTIIFGLIALKILLIFILNYPLNHNIYLKVMFQTPVLLESILYLKMPWGSLIASASLFINLFGPGTVSAWGEILPGSSIWEKAFTFLFQILLILFLSRYKYQNSQLKLVLEQKEQLNRALRKVVDTNLDYQTYASSVRDKTLAEERKRVSRELHDIIGYTLTNQLMITQAALSFKQEDRSILNTLLKKSEVNIRESLDDARAALRQLRAEYRPRAHGLGLFLKLSRTFQEVTGIEVNLEFSTLSEDLSQKEEKTLYRFIQEGLTNSFRHGHADKIQIILGEEQDYYECMIRDNGLGAVNFEDGIGMKGMKERIEALGGDFSATAVKNGFLLKCRLPKGEHDD